LLKTQRQAFPKVLGLLPTRLVERKLPFRTYCIIGAPHLYIEGPYFAYVMPLLYDLLRSASKIELFYKLRGAGAGPRRFTSERIGHTGRTTAYKELRRTLIREGVLSKEGVFVENGPNVWLARLPERVQDPRVAVYVGRRIPYLIFLALVLKESKDFESPYRLAQGLRTPLTSTYAAVRLLIKRGLIEQARLEIAEMKSAKKLQQWLNRYLDLTIQHANLKHDSSSMFKAVPAYIDGLEALQRVKYEAGMPIGPSPMIIRTCEAFRPFWMRALDEVDELKERSRMVSIGPSGTNNEIVWISGLPYASKPNPIS